VWKGGGEEEVEGMAFVHFTYRQRGICGAMLGLIVAPFAYM